ncbi:hypothetical protein FYK55_28110 [Roseiconus nitratireducens]|uniref:Cytochrome c domain-containing protein n=1 Tax=Roseiconus nitratireducens TaxID=2605748 RepID=A0A5M6CUA6_9BACT|nr:hypothetical protein [Roseiconus nitratireducens]KAA5537950.1 hypothetical protein FYK55_28110 [Roseiconus nitratireducens]
MPIFKSPNPSSCVQCHLAGVDLKDYIRPSHQQTFAALRDQGLIDLEHPERSKILHLITMGEQDLDKGARLIHAKARNAEYEAFAAWIKACCRDPELQSLVAGPADAVVGPDRPLPVIRHARKDRLLDSFVRNIWSQRMRCFPCHTPHELDSEKAASGKAGERYANLKRQYGARMDLFKASPRETMRQLIVSSRSRSEKHLPLINVGEPANSLLVLKPTSKLPPKTDGGEPGTPSSLPPVSHGGGLKMHVDDQSYKAFLAWIQDYANLVQDRYASEEDLPEDNWFPTDCVLRVRGTPESWPALTTVQLFVHRWDDDQKAWQSDPLAFTQAIVTPRGMVNGALFLIRSQQDDPIDDPAAMLPPGRYLVKAYVDARKRLRENPTALLNDQPSDAEAVVQAQWRTGFPNAEVIPGEQFQPVNEDVEESRSTSGDA